MQSSRLMILRHVLRNGKASNARSFPGSLTPLCLAISSLLPRLETGQADWSFLATRYNCTYDFALEFHIELKFYQIRQDSSQSISDYYSQTTSMWKQLAAADPPLKYDEDIDLFALFSTVELAKKRVK
uniref:Retrotransposon gag domain-containing protein n=1 Tax=Fagus sylvatica TaxID=28930 RepID=A0A2N9HFF1_FAGSY